jgi:chromosome segregation protein
MAITMTPVGQLDSAFSEVEAAREDLKKKEHEEQEAQREADETSGLVAAVSRELKNAEARYRVLSNVDDTATKNLKSKQTQLATELAATERELSRAQESRQRVAAAKRILDEAALAVMNGIAAAKAAAEAAAQAKTDAMKAQASKTSGKGADLANRIDELDRSHSGLQEQISKLNNSHIGIRAEANTLEAKAHDATTEVNTLTALKQSQETDLAKVTQDLAEGPGGDLEEAKDELDTAQQAHDAAPDAERSGKAALKQARKAREEAQERLRLARAKRDKVERLFIRGIDVSGPDANGTFTAKAEAKETIPDNYQLRWSSSAGAVNPETSTPDETVSFTTKGLPPGSYDIEVRLERVP